MSLFVYGKIYLTNGQLLQVNGGYKAINGSDIDGSQAELIIKNGEVTIEYDSSLEKEVEKFKDRAVVWIYHISKCTTSFIFSL
jgi:hypothetical protein